MDIHDQLNAGKEKTALCITNRDLFNGSFKIQVEIVYVSDQSLMGEASMGLYCNAGREKNRYKNMFVSTQQGEGSDNDFMFLGNLSLLPSDSELYLEDAVNFVDAAKKINKKLLLISVNEGFDNSFEEYLIRLARVIKAQAFYFEGYLCLERNDDIGDLRGYIQSIIKDNQVQLGYKKAA